MANDKSVNNKGFYTIPFVWNRRLWAMTFAFFVLWIGVAGWMLYQLICVNMVTASLISFILFNVVMLAMILGCEGFAPQRLEVGESKIVILRRYKSITIGREEIDSIVRLPKNAMFGAVRTGGVGGLFGYYGKYYTRGLGHFMLYATTYENLFMISKTDGQRVVISCSDPDVLEKFYKIE